MLPMEIEFQYGMSMMSRKSIFHMLKKVLLERKFGVYYINYTEFTPIKEQINEWNTVYGRTVIEFFN
jgi:hypothetical protein